MRLKDLDRNHPANELNHKIAYNLVHALKLKSLEELTPDYLSNICASQLMAAGITMTAVAETQMWLKRHGHSLQRKPPENWLEIQAIKRSIAILDAFYFDAGAVQTQLERFESDDVE